MQYQLFKDKEITGDLEIDLFDNAACAGESEKIHSKTLTGNFQDNTVSAEMIKNWIEAR